jgi:hypothetical protein
VSGFVKVALGGAALALLALQPALLAQADGSSSQSRDRRQSNTAACRQVTATGCLKRNSEGGFYLTDRTGSTWILTSNSVDLAKHVFHSVTVAGCKVTSSTEQEPPPSQDSAGAYPGLQVTRLTLLSPSCTR